MSSIVEISKKIGLSTATVSRALDPRFASKVSESTRKRILDCCDRYNYRPSFNGRSFVTGKTFKVGFIFGAITIDIGNPLGGLFMRGACSELQKSGYSAVVLYAGGQNSTETEIIDILRSNVADAYVIGGSLITDKVFEVIRRTDRPVLLTGRKGGMQDVSAICCNADAAYCEIWRKIPSGWRGRIIYAGSSGVSTDQKFKAVCAEAPKGMEPEFIPLEFPFNEFCYDRHSARIAAEKMVDRLSRCRLLWCASDLTAFGFADALSAAGITPGKDIYLIGHDNIEGIFGFSGKPFLSTIDARWEERGKLSAQISLESIRCPGIRKIDFPFAYVSRRSFPDFIQSQKTDSEVFG